MTNGTRQDGSPLVALGTIQFSRDYCYNALKLIKTPVVVAPLIKDKGFLQYVKEPFIVRIALQGKLGEGRYALVDSGDFHRINQHAWYLHAGGYARTRHGILMHRLVISPPDDLEIDHRDGNGLDNRRANLRIANRAQNGSNLGLKSTNTSGFKGVSWNKHAKLWVAEITHHRKRYSLGCHKTPEAAAIAYDVAAVRLHGEFARVNFPLAMDTPLSE